MNRDSQAIAQRRRQWVEAVNGRDVDGYVGLLTADVVWLPPGQPALRGRTAFRDWVRPFFDQYAYNFSIDGVRLRVHGDWALERATFTSQLTPVEGGEPMSHTGTYVLLWRRDDDGVWRIERYADDTGLAAEAPRTEE